MVAISQILTIKIDTIIARWMDLVRQDKRIESANELSDTALKDSLPVLLEEMVKSLAYSETEAFETVIKASLEHGSHRAKEGFDAAEITREYNLLRQVIFYELEPELVKNSPAEILRVIRLIDAVIDEAMSQCFKRYVELRLEELEQLRSQLMLNNQELTRLVRASRDSLAYMAHEFKTPLTSIIGYSDLFIRQHQKKLNAEDTFPSISSIERVLRGGRQLLRVVNDALELSRYDADKIKLNLVPTDIRIVVEDVVETIEPLARTNGLELKVDCEKCPNEVMTDPFRLQQIITNLLSNAVRYTDMGSVQLDLATQPNQNWSITVIDTGIGIAPEDRNRIFEPYAQAFGKDVRRQSESTGLGLAIVARLVKLLQGEIKVDSEPGVGSTFTVTFPQKIQI